MSPLKPVVWTVAGSDSGGGAGIQADLRTFSDLGVHGCSAITALTAQTSNALLKSYPVSGEQLNVQLEALAADLQPAAIKVGQIATSECGEVLLNFLEHYDGAVVVDPVTVSTGGSRLSEQCMEELLPSFYPHVSLVTPNTVEAEALTGVSIREPNDQRRAGAKLIAAGAAAVVVKGGHASGDWAQDYYFDGDAEFWLSNPRRDAQARGTGCVFSSAIAAFIAQGKDLRDAIVLANAYVQQGLRLADPISAAAAVLANSGWPNELADYPQVSGAAQDIDLPAFASCETKKLGLYPIVDSVEWLHKLLPLGITTIQLRIKDADPTQLERSVAQAVEIANRHGARLFINDYWELALRHKAYGVHLGQEDLDTADLAAIRSAGMRLGISTHSEFEWARAVTLHPSYIALGTVYPTQTKPARLIGTSNLSRWVKLLGHDFPLTAIGGINRGNVAEVLDCGVLSVAVASAITGADDYAGATSALAECLELHQSR